MSNIGYILCHVLALTGFLLLRRDRPNWPRPIKVNSVPACGSPGAHDGVHRRVLLIVGAPAPPTCFNGLWALGWNHFARSASASSPASVLLFFYRRIVQDREPIHWNEPTPAMPEGADRDALIAAGAMEGAPAMAVTS